MTYSQVSWVDGRRACYWPGLENKGYSFYRRVKRVNVEYEVGSGIYVPGLIPKSRDIARIHCLYENGDTLKPSDRYRAIIEIFLPPIRYKKLAKENGLVLHEDIEIIQDGKAKFYNTTIESFLGKCYIVFSMANENPEKELLKYFKKHTEPTYICRLKLEKTVFKCVISGENSNQNLTSKNKKIESDDDCIIVNAEDPKRETKNYKVTSVECKENSVKMKISSSVNVEIMQPKILLDTINLGNHTKSPQKHKIFTDSNSKENLGTYENTEKNRRKQNLSKKMYNSENLGDKQNIFEIENVVKKINDFQIVTPKKNQRRARTKSIDSVDNEPVKKTPRKTKKILDLDENDKGTVEITKSVNKKSKNLTTPKKNKHNNDESESEPLKKTPRKNNDSRNTDLETITDKIKSKLSIITPKKTPVRRRLDSLNENENVEKNNTPLRKSSRITACTKNLTSDIDSDIDDSIKTTSRSTRKSLRMSIKSIPRIVDNLDLSDYSENVEDVLLNKRNTRKSSRNNPEEKSWRNQENMSDSDSENEYMILENNKNKRKSTRLSSAPKNTPSKTKTPSRIKVSNLSTQLTKRTSQIHVSSDTLEKARAQLRNASHSEKFEKNYQKSDKKKDSNCLPCRETEYEDIINFLKGKLKDKNGGCMYISGVPGTGKTATVSRCLLALQKGYKSKSICVNALSLTEPKQVYVEIFKQISKGGNLTVRWEEALEWLRNYFIKTVHESHILVIDELDKLCTRKQDVIYNLLDLPGNSRTPLIVIAIANTMDLPERLLSNKVNSRLGLTRVSFRPYKFSELADIVKLKLGANLVNAFRNEAIEFVARKVAAVSGDARRAIALCARATELAKSQNAPSVTMEIINQTLKETSGSNNARAIKSLPTLHKTVLRATAHEVSRTGNDETSFSQIVRVCNEFCTLDGLSNFSVSQLLMAVQTLSAIRLIIAQEGQKDTGGTILLNISADDIHFALKDD